MKPAFQSRHLVLLRPIRRSIHSSIIISQQQQPAIITPLELYNKRVDQGKLRDDPYQRKIITSLSVLHENLSTYTPPEVTTPDISELKPRIGVRKIFGSFFGKGKNNNSMKINDEGDANEIKGIYLYGDVGCGKTMLMDLFYSTIPKDLPKTRIHFHQFMQNLHKRSHQLKMEYSASHGGGQDLDVIPLLAVEIAQKSTVLCFDEFQVTDVADAMLLRRLLMILLSKQYGVILFATSNRAPDDLYLNGIQRVSFIPCIQLIKNQTRVIYLNSPTDYRKVPKPISSVYYFPKPGVKWDSKTNLRNREEHIKSWYDYFNRENDDQSIQSDYSLTVWGRELKIPKCSPEYVAQFTFHELCGMPRSAGDYLMLANSFQSFIVTDIPYLSIDVRDSVRRFITFLDAVYDAHGRLAVTAAAPFKDLFVEPEDLQRGNYKLYKKTLEKENALEEHFKNDELVTKHGFDKVVAKKANIFANDEEKFAFARALSRLAQMSTTEWIDDVRDLN
ncbi:AFG1 [[Candida] subhashii]|uniref:AFG1 n=1 Tax=[Candida] subhashii TaxID=561895 RepID=A0A8J5QK11_9ASCO|nr:AFG1 [[Candida] subhashii]KAG7664497.1 AFG1 [[Candida] subhashii]